MSVFICFLLLFHGGFHEQIILVNEEIKTDPSSPDLYFKRAKLYFHHEVYDSCIIDLKFAYRNGLESDLGYTFLSKSYFNLNILDSAQYYLNQVIEIAKIKHLTEAIQGDIFHESNQYFQAAKSYEQALKYTIRPRPENFEKIILSYRNIGTEAGDILAIQWCQKAIQNHGHLPIYHQNLMDIYLNQQDYNQALILELAYSENFSRKETSYYTLAELYLLNKDNNMAKTYIQKAKESIIQLKPNQRNNRATKALEKKIDDLKNKLK